MNMTISIINPNAHLPTVHGRMDWEYRTTQPLACDDEDDESRNDMREVWSDHIIISSYCPRLTHHRAQRKYVPWVRGTVVEAEGPDRSVASEVAVLKLFGTDGPEHVDWLPLASCHGPSRPFRPFFIVYYFSCVLRESFHPSANYVRHAPASGTTVQVEKVHRL